MHLEMEMSVAEKTPVPPEPRLSPTQVMEPLHQGTTSEQPGDDGGNQKPTAPIAPTQRHWGAMDEEDFEKETGEMAAPANQDSEECRPSDGNWWLGANPQRPLRGEGEEEDEAGQPAEPGRGDWRPVREA